MKKVILAGIRTTQTVTEFETMMCECVQLCHACHMEVVGTITQSARTLHTHTAFRTGKLEELKYMVQELGG